MWLTREKKKKLIIFGDFKNWTFLKIWRFWKFGDFGNLEILEIGDFENLQILRFSDFAIGDF